MSPPRNLDGLSLAELKAILPLALGVLILLDVGCISAQAQPYSACSSYYTSGNTTPTGNGSAWDTIFGVPEVSLDCNANTMTVGGGNQNQRVYKQGYVYSNNTWQPLSLTSSSALNNCYVGLATAYLGGVDLTNTMYVVGFVGDLNGQSWKHGCGDSACSTHGWQLQAVKGTVSTVASSSCPDSQNGSVASTWSNIYFQSENPSTSSITITDSANQHTVTVTQSVLSALAGIAPGTSITLYEYPTNMTGNFMSGTPIPWSCVMVGSSSSGTATGGTTTGDVRSVAFSEMSNNATISVSVGTILDFTSGHSNVGSSVVSSSNPAVVSVISSTQAQANAAGTAVITINLFQSSGTGQIGSPTPHYVMVNVQ